MSRPFRFSVLGGIAPSMAAWRDRAREAEALGYSAYYVYDEIEAQYGPLVAATVAAEATTTLHVGMLVLNNDLRNPVVVARELATLALAAEGRVEVGFGAGFQRSQYAGTGIPFDAAGKRVGRLAESLEVMTSLWRDGLVTFEGEHVAVTDAICDPRPTLPVRLIVGGSNPRILALAVRYADTVGVNHSTSRDAAGDLSRMYAPDHYDRCAAIIRDAAGSDLDSLEVQIAAAAVKVVKADRSVGRIASMLGFTSPEAVNSPAVLIGSPERLCEHLIEGRERWGFSHIVIPSEFVTDFAPVVAALNDQ